MDADSADKKRVLIAAGGTGGHVFPALAVATILRERGMAVRWIGTADRIEARVIPPTGIPIAFVQVSALRGKGWLGYGLFPFRLLRSCWQTWRVFSEFKPHVVLGMGGFTAGPSGVLAAVRRTPLIIHEQNAIAGLTNRYLARLATQVLTAFPRTFPAVPQAVCVGNPVRQSLYQVQPEPASESLARSAVPRVLVVGGSLGALSLNTTVPRALSLSREKWRVLHQTGRGKLASTQVDYAALSIDAELCEFIDDVATAYANADLVICRAGATTCAELAAVGVAAILVPYPHAVDDHQTANAQALVDAGAAVLMKESSLSAQTLATTLDSLLSQPQTLRAMAEAAKRLAEPQAASRVADFVQELSS